MRAGRRRGDVFSRPGLLLRLLTTALLGLVLITGAPLGPAHADPGTPGIPQRPTRVYNEDFGNTTATVPVSLSDYVGASPAGQTYTADPDWLNTACNGSIVRGNMAESPVGRGCTGNSWGGVRQLAWALGKLRGDSDREAFDNYALSSFTQSNPDPGVVFATETDIPLSSVNRFLVFTVDAIASNCDQAHPELLFSIVNGPTATPLGDVLDPCAGRFSVLAPAIEDVTGIGPLVVRGGTLRSTDAFLYNGSSFGLELRNEQTSGFGNDSAIDNISVVDATPQLDQSFSPERLPAGDTATLTYTITNTTDLAAKSGWRLANTLPAGLSVAAEASTTCSATEVVAAVGGRSVAVANGTLNTGQSSCTISVPVSADTVATFLNEPGDFTLRGLEAAAAASLVTIDPEPTASLDIEKTAGEPVDANDSGRTDAGDTITYTFSVENTGEVPIAAIVVVDSLLADPTVCAEASLDLGVETTCTSTYEITQDDVDAGKVDNTATASGEALGEAVSARSSTSTNIDSPVELKIDKSADPPNDQNGNGRADAGDTIDYTFVVTNTGAVTVGEVDVDDDLISAISCGETTLAPAGDTTCSGRYTITQDDVDTGSVVNSAAAVGATPTGAAVTSLTDSTSTATDDTAGLSFRQTAASPTDTDDNDQISAGDRIRYTFTVGNTGSVTIADLAVDSGLLRDAPECGTTTLLPGDTTTCTGTYRISQDDVDAGSVTNTANATGTDPGGDQVTSPEDSIETGTTAGSGLSLTKRGGPPVDVNANRVTDRGDTIFYSFTVRNTGGVSLSQIAVTDRRLSGVTCADTSLDPGQSTTCLAEDDYVITQADMDEGTVANQATATAEQPDGDLVQSVAATETTPVRVVRAVGLVQRLVPIEDVDGSGRDDTGDRIGFGFTVVNTGTVSLTDVTVRDPLLDDSGVGVSCPVSDLAPGETLTCTSDPYVITDADVTSGSVVSVATVTARTPMGASLTSVASSITVPLDESEEPTPDPTAVPPPGTRPPGPAGPPPGGSVPTPAPKSLSLWIPALALLLLVPEAVLLIWRYRRNRLAAAAAAARREKRPRISIWMGR